MARILPVVLFASPNLHDPAMLSYRHAFHAGNPADVLKHLIQIQLLRYLNQKDKPYWVVDTHAGAGAYRLDSDHARKNAEFAEGIGRLWSCTDLPPAVADYVAVIRRFNPNGTLRHYPGSPLISLDVMREADRLRCFELHGTDFRLLQDNLAEAGKRAAAEPKDGFLSIKSVLPPPPRRGLIVIDPAYEDKRDYLRVIQTVKEGLSRFANGVFMIWYPQLQRGDARELPEKLCKLPAQRWLHASLSVRAPSPDGFGMHGSGVVILNPPWTLAATLAETLPWLRDTLAQDDHAGFTLTSGDHETPA